MNEGTAAPTPKVGLCKHAACATRASAPHVACGGCAHAVSYARIRARSGCFVSLLQTALQTLGVGVWSCHGGFYPWGRAPQDPPHPH